MSGKWEMTGRLNGAASLVTLLCAGLSAPALAQVYDDVSEEALTATAEDYRRYEAERRRQEQLQLERERREQQRIRLENERLRRENERREQERLRLENERLRQEIELAKQEQLRLEIEAKERERARAAALHRQAQETDQGIDPGTYEQLQKIGQLYDQGILTDEEFQRLKDRILD
jgi:hypothetical protein